MPSQPRSSDLETSATPQPESGHQSVQPIQEFEDRDPWRRTVIAATILLVMGPIGYYSSRAEIAYWQHAAGFEQLLNGNLEKSLEFIDNAIKWNPYSYELFTTRATWKIRQGTIHETIDDALPDCHRAVALARFADIRQPSLYTKSILASTLNLLAYTRALAKEDFDTALDEINESISLLTEISPDSVDASVLDTLGYIEHLRGNHEESLEAMLKSVHFAERNFQHQQRALKQQRMKTIDSRLIDHSQQVSRGNMAVLYHHLGLAYESSGKVELAEKNLKLADKYGYNPTTGVW